MNFANCNQHTVDQVTLIRLHGQQWKDQFAHETQQRRALGERHRYQNATLKSQRATQFIRVAAVHTQMKVLFELTRQFNAERQALKQRHQYEMLVLKTMLGV